MKSVNQLISQKEFNANQAPEQPKTPDPNDQQTAAIVNKIFQLLQVAFPAWKTSFPDAESVSTAKKVWIKAFAENGIGTLEQVGHGMRKARASESPFWPSVGQFIAWCTPDDEDLGLPHARKAYHEACHFYRTKQVSHPAVYAALQETGAWELAHLTERESWPLFESVYAVVVRRVLNGEDLAVEVPKPLPSPETIPLTPEQIAEGKERGRKVIAEMRKMLGGING